ncbi:TRAP transporter small permease [Brevibacterium sp. H602]|uniref:TRAP transporter small permease n=1 Tax=unclassified Brevibacterium TaxID=2614124 RepID=UPI00397E5CA7
MMKTIDKYLSRLENVLAGGCLIAATALAVFAVLLRNITGDVIFWSEEAVIYLIIFSTFFGAVVTLRHNEHVAVDIMPALLKGKAKKFFVVLGGLATLVYAGFIAYLSWALITEPFSRTTITPALKLPLWVVELSLAVGMTLFFIRAVEMTIRALRTPAAELDKDVLAEEAAAVGIDVEDLAIVDDGSDRANRADGDNGNDRLGDGRNDEKGGDR